RRRPRRRPERSRTVGQAAGSASDAGATPWSQPSVGNEPGARTSATVAHRSVAVTGPRKLACTTPDPSATTTAGTASLAYFRGPSGAAVTSRSWTATASLASSLALSHTPRQVWQVADVNTATSHGASGRSKARGAARPRQGGGTLA